MRILIACFIAVLLASIHAQDTNYPEVKAALSLEVIEVAKNVVVRPFIENNLQNFHVDQNLTLEAGALGFSTKNLTIKSLELDWDNTHLLTVTTPDVGSIVLRNVTTVFNFDAGVRIYNKNIAGSNCTIKVIGMDIQIDLGFQDFQNGTSFLFIKAVNVSIGRLDIHMSEELVNAILQIGRDFGLKPETIVSTFITNGIIGLNSTIINSTTNGIQLILPDYLEVDLGLANLAFRPGPPAQAFQTLSLNLKVSDWVNHRSAPVSQADIMPDYVENSYAVQLSLSDNSLSQIIWGVMESGLVNIVFSTKNMPASVPLSLTSNNLAILIPFMEQMYGDNKGVYLQIMSGQEDPFVSIRDGRLNVILSATLSFYVDEDSTHYPDEGLPACQAGGNCDEAISLDASIYASVTLYELSAAVIGVKVIDVQLSNVYILSSKGDLDVAGFKSNLNQLLGSLVGQINVQLANGIPNPLIGKYGVTDTGFSIGTDYLFLGLDIDPSARIRTTIKN